ncbi:hypothetical protein Pmani_009327 [Petrolisthes manimaculis]|uniref:RING-type domain-containing protein n=1 Tax=Petrolisthes manimaculis TaxID=1843537 RepID=A0AAE1UI15_9EUCA|nr:hypothetical protein Pmani_009327 [Petrolisthes manimaculis]
MECVSCSAEFVETEHLPRNLRCGHVCCSRCLQLMVTKHDVVDCPQCGCKQAVDSLEELPLSKGLLDAVKTIQELRVSCVGSTHEGDNINNMRVSCGGSIDQGDNTNLRRCCVGSTDQGDNINNMRRCCVGSTDQGDNTNLRRCCVGSTDQGDNINNMRRCCVGSTDQGDNTNLRRCCVGSTDQGDNTNLRSSTLHGGSLVSLQSQYQEVAHQLVPVISDGPCEDHGYYKVFYCLTCKVWICRDCTITEHPTRTCQVQSVSHGLNSMKHQVKEDIKKNIIASKSQLKAMKRFARVVDNHSDSFRNTVAKILQTLEENKRDRKTVSAACARLEANLKQLEEARGISEVKEMLSSFHVHQQSEHNKATTDTEQQQQQDDHQLEGDEEGDDGDDEGDNEGDEEGDNEGDEEGDEEGDNEGDEEGDDDKTINGGETQQDIEKELCTRCEEAASDLRTLVQELQALKDGPTNNTQQLNPSNPQQHTLPAPPP